ncbi:MAG: DUF2147 domain-containing protein [Treponema sp.]|nr:DUF2147 domain-containing protein [Treponema sp.]
MKKIITLLICLSIAAVCFAQDDPVVGYWISIDENTNRMTAGWQIYIENNMLYGKILSLADQPRGTIATELRERYDGFPLPGRVNTMQVAGPPWIYGLTKNTRNGEWSGGKIINPEDGKFYNCRIIFRPAGSRAGSRTFTQDMLEMRGEIGLGIGRSQFWRKTDEATASNLWPN